MANFLFFICLLQSMMSVTASFQLDNPWNYIFRRQNITTTTRAPACSSQASIISRCETAYPGFLDLPDSQKAECLCYIGTTWVPTVFDGWVALCASWAKTADPTDYTAYDSWAGLCTSVGPLFATPALSTTIKTPTPTPTTRTTPNSPAGSITTPPPSIDFSVNPTIPEPIPTTVTQDTSTPNNGLRSIPEVTELGVIGILLSVLGMGMALLG